ncbi:SpoIID/LytB domain protein [Scopulibacillus darangshiensis]|uniref:SpoIID/LytB domain protein n=1 Tax=Scopulibacillus darangshiensis TaxID=442528 RepID=A0A4R2NHL7_9BACL|nr:SpoIID/LytB domain-containing protein [Scopulibacillus darangshiensis]TCP20877.1 SpoIID/LytB domain protein [Scopulibacillus darangshiensis]
MKRKLSILFAMILLFSILPAYQSHAASEPMVKVKLVNFLGNQSHITLEPQDTYSIKGKPETLHKGKSYILKVEGRKLSLYEDKKRIGSFKTLSVSPKKGSSRLSVNGRDYGGSFQFILENGSFVRPINTLSIEDYVKGVLPREMPPSWHIEAVKAQAVAARTYALRYGDKVINDTISYQVYGGADQQPASNKAVNLTRGEVMYYDGKLVDAVYSASNGGKTESNANAWSGKPLGYLKVKNDPYDPKMVWHTAFNKQQINLAGMDLKHPGEWWSKAKEKDQVIAENIKHWLRNNDYAGNEIKVVAIPNLSFSDKGSGGRVTKGSLAIQYLVKGKVDAKKRMVINKLELKNKPATTIRAILGNRQIRSYVIDNVSDSKNKLTIEGRGDGHGVGMSQYGAKQRAEAGQTYKDILGFYYDGAALSADYQPENAIPLPNKAGDKKLQTGKVNAIRLNLRTGPSMSFKVIGQLKKDQRVEILGKKGEWYKVQSGKQKGYVYEKYLSKEK